MTSRSVGERGLGQVASDITFRSYMGVEEIQHWGSDEMVARSARVSTGRDQIDGLKIEGLIGYLVREGHWSTLEHSGLTVRIEAPLFILGQFVRHRHISVNVQSGRYSEFKPVFYIPGVERGLFNRGSSARPDIRPGEGNATMRNLARGDQGFSGEPTARNAIESSWDSYVAQSGAGVANEVARNVLPQSTYTSWYASANLHAWLDYLAKRDGSHGHPQFEHVELAVKIGAILHERFPITMKAWEESR